MRSSYLKILGFKDIQNKTRNYFFTVLIVSVILISGILSSFLLTKRLQNQEFEKLHAEFYSDVNPLIYAFHSEINLRLASLSSIKSLFDSSDFVSRKEFSRFTSEILKQNKDIVACEWIPKVKRSEMAKFVNNAKSEGLKNYKFTEEDKNGELVQITAREVYYPIYYIEPLNENELALGYDLGSNISRLETMEIAIKSRKAVASNPLTLVQEEKNRKPVMILKAVFEKHSLTQHDKKNQLLGFVSIIIYPTLVLENILDEINPKPIGIEIISSDISGKKPEEIIIHKSRTKEEKVYMGIEYSKSFIIGERDWKFQAYPTKTYLKNKLSNYPVYVFITGALLTILLALYILSLKRNSFEIEKLVIKKTSELENTHSQLLHAEKLSAIGKLTASIAHEFNNPLYGITSVIKGIGRRVKLSKKDADLVDMAGQECDRMKKLIQELQDFNRPTSGSFSNVNLHNLIDQLLMLTKKALKEKNIKFDKQYARKMPAIYAIEDQIKQVILNLMNNAIDACGKGGEVKITTEVIGIKQVAIHFCDSGHGIEPEHIGHIFEPFFSTKPEKKGSGLGLSVSYGIAQRHGGELKVDSQPGKTIFSLILPIKNMAK